MDFQIGAIFLVEVVCSLKSVVGFLFIAQCGYRQLMICGSLSNPFYYFSDPLQFCK